MKTTKSLLMLAALATAAWIIHDVRLSRKPAPPAKTLTEIAARRVAPRLPAPGLNAHAPISPESGESSWPSNLLARVLKGDEYIKLTMEQVEPFLRDNKRSAESLLGAFRATGNKELLREAMEKYPNDPRVCCAACFDILHDKTASEETKLQRLDSFKKAAPDNALPYYLEAASLFKAGRTDDAVREMIEAAGKTKYRDYSLEFTQNAEEAYLAAGYTQIEAKAASAFDLPLPQLAILKKLGQNLGELSGVYQQAGDSASAQAALQLGLTVARQVGGESQPNWFVNNLVGIAIEKQILDRMDPSAAYNNSATVKERLDELSRQRQTINELSKNNLSFMQGMSEQDIITYFDRIKVSGEMEAMRWVRNRMKQP